MEGYTAATVGTVQEGTQPQQTEYENFDSAYEDTYDNADGSYIDENYNPDLDDWAAGQPTE